MFKSEDQKLIKERDSGHHELALNASKAFIESWTRQD